MKTLLIYNGIDHPLKYAIRRRLFWPQWDMY